MPNSDIKGHKNGTPNQTKVIKLFYGYFYSIKLFSSFDDQTGLSNGFQLEFFEGFSLKIKCLQRARERDREEEIKQRKKIYNKTF